MSVGLEVWLVTLESPALVSFRDVVTEHSRTETSRKGQSLSTAGKFTFFFFVVVLFRAAPTAYGSQARDQIRAAAASLHHSPSTARSEPHL